MRLLFVGKMPISYTGGAEVSTRHLLEALVRRGHAVDVAAGIRKRSVSGIRDVLVYKATGRPRERMDSRSFAIRASVDPLWSLRSLLALSAPDAVVVLGTDPVFAREALQAAVGVPRILFIRVEAALSVDREAQADAVATNSEYMADRARDLGMKATHVPSLFPADDYRVTGRRSKVLFVNPIPKKGADIALALARGRPDVPFAFNLSWRIDPRYLRRLKREVRRLPNVEIRDATPNPKVLYRDCRVVLVPSQCEEAWGRVVSEAHVNSIPVVASDAGGLPEAVGPGGILVHPRNDIDAWHRALSQLWDDKELYARLSSAAGLHARRSELSETSVIARFEGVVAGAIGSRARRDPKTSGARESIP
jgi:glycosyltransferase involved in cell wall biosynthesis